jgi:hypothetical protein
LAIKQANLRKLEVDDIYGQPSKNTGRNSKSPKSKKRSAVFMGAQVSANVSQNASPARNLGLHKFELTEDTFNTKADVNDLNAMNDVKANKVDTEAAMRCVDILHKQLSHLIVLFVEAMKTLIHQQKESETEKQTRRMYVMQQSVKVMQWINLFEP